MIVHDFYLQVFIPLYSQFLPTVIRADLCNCSDIAEMTVTSEVKSEEMFQLPLCSLELVALRESAAIL